MKHIKILFWTCIFGIHGSLPNFFTRIAPHIKKFESHAFSSFTKPSHSKEKFLTLFPFFLLINFLTESTAKHTIEKNLQEKKKRVTERDYALERTVYQTLYSYVTNSSIYYLSNIASNILMDKSFKKNHRIYAALSLSFLSVLMVKNSHKTFRTLLLDKFVNPLSIQEILFKASFFAIGNILPFKAVNYSSIKRKLLISMRFLLISASVNHWKLFEKNNA